MFYSLFCHFDIDDDFDDAYEDEEAFINEDDVNWYSNEKLIKTKVYRYCKNYESLLLKFQLFLVVGLMEKIFCKL